MIVGIFRGLLPKQRNGRIIQDLLRDGGILRHGMLRNLGISNPIEVAGGPLKMLRKDVASLTARTDGTILLSPGLMSVGQDMRRHCAYGVRPAWG